jgi:predicted small lipoprotein YifL
MRLRQRPLSVLALSAAACVALALAGCGRKSGLDLPPSAEAAPPQQAQTQSTMLPLQRPPKQKQPAPPKRDLPIDVLLN